MFEAAAPRAAATEQQATVGPDGAKTKHIIAEVCSATSPTHVPLRTAASPHHQLHPSLQAIMTGAPIYNAGDAQGCCDVYTRTARHLVEVGCLTEAQTERIRAALAADDAQRDAGHVPAARAWAMRLVLNQLEEDADSMATPLRALAAASDGASPPPASHGLVAAM